MGLSRTVPEMNGGFGRKNAFFPIPLFNAPVDGVLLVMAFRLKKRLMLLLVRCIFLRHVQSFRRNATIGQKNEETDRVSISHASVGLRRRAMKVATGPAYCTCRMVDKWCSYCHIKYNKKLS